MTGTNTTSILKWHKGTITSLTPAQAIHSPGHAKMAQYNYDYVAVHLPHTMMKWLNAHHHNSIAISPHSFPHTQQTQMHGLTLRHVQAGNELNGYLSNKVTGTACI